MVVGGGGGGDGGDNVWVGEGRGEGGDRQPIFVASKLIASTVEEEEEGGGGGGGGGRLKWSRWSQRGERIYRYGGNEQCGARGDGQGCSSRRGGSSLS